MKSSSASRIPVLLASLMAFALAAGCASDKKSEYISEGSKQDSRKTLEVPPDLVTPGSNDRFQAPGEARRTGTAGAGGTSLSAMNKPGTAASAPLTTPDEFGKLRIARAGNQRWLVLPGTPQAVWPQIRKFWEDLGFTIKSDSAQLYIMETDWAEKRSKVPGGVLANIPLIRGLIGSGERDKFRTRLETGTEPGTVEIYVSHRGLEEADVGNSLTSNPGWILKPGEPDLELEMLRRMMVAMGADEGTAGLAVKAQEAVPDRARLTNAADGTLQLTMDDPLDRAWRQIGLSLDRVGMVVEDRDRAKGYYFVRYITDEDLGKKKDSSWFSWMAFWRDKKPDIDQYRIQVQGSGDKTLVSVQDKAGKPASPDSAKQILTLLYNQVR